MSYSVVCQHCWDCCGACEVIYVSSSCDWVEEHAIIRRCHKCLFLLFLFGVLFNYSIGNQAPRVYDRRLVTQTTIITPLLLNPPLPAPWYLLYTRQPQMCWHWETSTVSDLQPQVDAPFWLDHLLYLSTFIPTADRQQKPCTKTDSGE